MRVESLAAAGDISQVGELFADLEAQIGQLNASLG